MKKKSVAANVKHLINFQAGLMGLKQRTCVKEETRGQNKDERGERQRGMMEEAEWKRKEEKDKVGLK